MVSNFTCFCFPVPPLIWGVSSHEKIVSIDSRPFICDRCGPSSTCIRIKYDNYFTFCFLRCCKIGEGQKEILVCKGCRQETDGFICDCGFMGKHGPFCSNCGKKKEMCKLADDKKKK